MTKPRDLQALVAMLDARIETAFAWRDGRDCVSFAARAVKAQTGIDPRGKLRWKNKREAYAAIVAEGNLMAAIDSRLDRVPPALAMRGDIAAVADETYGIRLMVIEGETLVGPGQDGLERQPRSVMVMAWDATTVFDSAAKAGGA